MGTVKGGENAATWNAVTFENGRKNLGQYELFGIESTVHPDGNDAKITLHLSGGENLTVIASLSHVSAIDTEIHSTAMLMHYRQSMKTYAGVTAFQDLILTALRPDDTAVIIDPKTGDRLFVMQFVDRLPIVIRMSPEQVNKTMERLSVVSKKKNH